jgi:5-methylcytosine-specific restriction endonuclease McrBC regulatory subunit McrC
MNEVFESFVYTALREALSRYGGDIRHHAIDHLDAAEEAFRVEPDITWWSGGRCRAVIDAKYKSLVGAKTMPNADAYQMLAYCITLGISAASSSMRKARLKRVRMLSSDIRTRSKCMRLMSKHNLPQCSRRSMN